MSARKPQSQRACSTRIGSEAENGGILDALCQLSGFGRQTDLRPENGWLEMWGATPYRTDIATVALSVGVQRLREGACRPRHFALLNLTMSTTQEANAVQNPSGRTERWDQVVGTKEVGDGE